MYLLSHEVPIAAFLNKDVGVGDFGWRTPQTLALRIEKLDSLPRDDRDVTVFQIVDRVGKGCEIDVVP
jgi:hypothetical protein